MSCGLFDLETHYLANFDALISKNLGLTHQAALKHTFRY
jgi:hypothetical protein